MTMFRAHRLIITLLVAATTTSLTAADVFTGEVRRDLSDAKSLALSPLHWHRAEWIRFGEGTAAVLALYAADNSLYNDVQRNRSSFTNNFAKDITPFGAHRAIELSVLMIAGGALAHQTETRDAGRDSLEAEFWAAGVVTPILKTAFGRARPSQDQGARSFHSLTSSSSHYQSFPSGHATNAFAFATAVAGHYNNWIVPTIVYTIASGVAFSRVNDRAHFPSDVLAGALIGRAVAKGIIARHQHSHVAWSLSPGVIADRPALVVHLSTH
jgi:membrane-associated phospholipid phosphatase